MSRRPPTRVLRTDATPEEQESAILDAAAREFADVGVRRANMDLVARRAGISRSTLYRRFANKEELLAAVLRNTSAVIGRDILRRVQGMTPADAIVLAMQVGIDQFETNQLLRRIVLTDPDIAGNIFGFVGPDMHTVLEMLSIGVARNLRAVGAQMPDDDLRVASELLVRLSASLLLGASPAIDLSSDAAVRTLVEKFLAKMVW